MRSCLWIFGIVGVMAAQTAGAGDGLCPEHYPEHLIFTLHATVVSTTGGGVVVRSDGSEREFIDQEIENFLYRPGETMTFTWDADFDQLIVDNYCFAEDEIIATTLSGETFSREVSPTAGGRAAPDQDQSSLANRQAWPMANILTLLVYDLQYPGAEQPRLSLYNWQNWSDQAGGQYMYDEAQDRFFTANERSNNPPEGFNYFSGVRFDNSGSADLSVLYTIQAAGSGNSYGIGEGFSEVQLSTRWTVRMEPEDTDQDGVANASDNCFIKPNPNQRDTDGDGLGNICDADFNQNCLVDFEDLAILKANFFSDLNPNTDLDGDGVTNFIDLQLFQALIFQMPGGSGLSNICGPGLSPQ